MYILYNPLMQSSIKLLASMAVFEIAVKVRTWMGAYRKISNRCRTKSQNDSRLILQLSSPNPLEPGVKSRNEDVVGGVPTGYAPTTSEW